MLDRSVYEKLESVVDKEYVIKDKNELIVYECDGFALNKSTPEAVVFPENTEEVSEVVKILNNEDIPFTSRGAGTGLSGGCLAGKGGVIICLSRMNKILEIDLKNKTAIVESGAINLQLTGKITGYGFFFAPDPSSQMSSTIGGNAAANAGGPHTLKYGSSVSHILGLQLVLPDGSIEQFGGKAEDVNGFDLTGLMIGSEGTLGIITKLTVKITHLPEGIKTLLADYDNMFDAAKSCSEIISSGIIPAAMEIIDYVMLEALKKAFDFKFPENTKALLVTEIDGIKEGMDRLGEKIISICKSNNAREVKIAKDAEERTHLWQARKRAFGAIGRISPNYLTNDGVVPRTKIPEMIDYVYKVGKKYSLTIANTFHAGDGNIHPAIMYDGRNPEQVEQMQLAAGEIMKKCVELGGTVSGEHGIGIYKKKYMKWIFSENDFKFMKNIKKIFDPDGLSNPDKIFN